MKKTILVSSALLTTVTCLSAIADDILISVGLRHIQHRDTIDIYAAIRNQPAKEITIEPRRLARALVIKPIQIAEGRRRRMRRKLRRLHAGDTPALLIDQDWRVFTANAFAQFIAVGAQFNSAFTMTRKNNETPRINIAKERTFFVIEPRPLAIKDRR